MRCAQSVEADTAVYRAAEPGSSPGARSNFSAELRYTLELARALNGVIDGTSATQERVGSHLAFDRALRRGKDALIAMLYAACDDLAPAEGEEVARFIRSLEYAEIPAGEFFSPPGAPAPRRGPEFAEKNNKPSKKNLRGLGRSSAGARAVKPSDPPLPSEEKSQEVMAQWR